MKKTVRFMGYAILVGVGFVLLIRAARVEAGGFGGDIYLGGVAISGRTSQLAVSDGNRRIDGLDERGEQSSDFVPYLSGELRYTLADTDTTFFVSNEDTFDGLALGIVQTWNDKGKIRIAGTYDRRDVWEDPYEVGVRRSRTDETALGVALDYEQILGSGLQFSTSIRKLNVDDDRIGQRRKELRREGYLSAFEIGYVLALIEDHQVIPSLRYEREDMRGKANASDGIALALTHVWQSGPWCFESQAGIGWTNYRQRHPIFDKRRKAVTYEVSTQISYYEPFGWSQVSVYTLAGYGLTDANIGFFDSDALTVGMGIGYHF